MLDPDPLYAAEDAFEGGYAVGSSHRLKAYAVGIALGFLAGIVLTVLVTGR